MKLPTPALFLTLAAALAATGPASSDPASGDFPRIEVPQSRKLATEGKAVIVDVRDSTAYFGNHIAGALSIPLGSVDEKADELKKSGKKVIAYCSCPSESTSGRAAQALREKGIEAFALQGGLRAWVDHGLPVKSGSEP